jgi:hypothetical protein
MPRVCREMTRNDGLLHLFRVNGGRLTLGQILARWDLVGSKYTSRIDDLRKKGFNIVCHECKERPTENVYTLVEFKIDGHQRTFA